MEKIGNFLQTRREAVGLTQMQVARALGYTTAQFVSNWERDLSYPPIKAIPKLAKLYRINGGLIFNYVLKAAVKITEKSLRSEYEKIKRGA